MSEKQTMQLEYQFTAEDVNVSAVINKMETNLENYNGEAQAFIKNTSKAEAELRSLSTSAKKAQADIKDTASAMKYFNNSKTSTNKMTENLASDIAKAKSLTKQMKQQQQSLVNLGMKSQLKGLDTTEIKTFETLSNQYRANTVELQKLDNKMATSFKTLHTNYEIAQQGLDLSKVGSDEETFFLKKVQSAEKGINKFTGALNDFADIKNSFLREFNDVDNYINDVASKYKLNVIDSKAVKNLNQTKENSLNKKNEVAEQIRKDAQEIKKEGENYIKTVDTFKDEKSSKNETNRTINDTDRTKNEPKGTKSSKKSKKETVSEKVEPTVIESENKEQKETKKGKKKTPTASKNGKVFDPSKKLKEHQEKVNMNLEAKKRELENRHQLKTESALRQSKLNKDEDNNKTKNKIKLTEAQNKATKEQIELKSQLKQQEDTLASDNKIRVNQEKINQAIKKQKAETKNQMKLNEQLHNEKIEFLKEETKSEKSLAKAKSKARQKEDDNRSKNKKEEYTSKTDNDIRKANNQAYLNEVEAEAKHFRNLEKMSENHANQVERDNNRTANSMKENQQLHDLEIDKIQKKTEANKEYAESLIKVNQEKLKGNAELDDHKTQNKKDVIDYKTQSNKDLDDYKTKNKKDFYDYTQQQQQIKKVNNERVNLIDNINKEAGIYKKMKADAISYQDGLDNISKNTDNIIKKNTLYSDSFDKVEKSLRTKEKSLISIGNRYENTINNTKKLIQSSKDYADALSSTKANLEAEITKLESLGSKSTETASKIEKLKAELKEVDSTMDALKSSTANLLSEMHQAGGQVEALGNDFDTLENKINECKNSVSGFSNKMATIGNIGGDFTKGMINAGDKAMSFTRNLSNVGQEIANIGREMQFLSLAGAGLFGSSIAIGLNYEGELATVKSTLSSVGKEAGYADKAIDKIDKKVREVSSKSIYSPEETMQMAKYLSLAGYDLDKIVGSLDSMSKLMAVSEMGDASKGVDLLTDSFASLGFGIKKATETDIEFADRFEKEINLYMDTLARMQSESNQTIEQAMEGYIYAGGEFDRLNIPLEQSGALLSVLASRGLKSAEAGRGLSSTLINLTKESGQSYEALKELYSLTGIDVFARFDEKGNYKLEQQLTNINDAFEKITQTYGESKGSEIINRLTGGIAGKTQIKTFSKLLEGYRNEYTHIKNLLSEDNVSGTMDSMLEDKSKSIKYKFEMMKASIQESLVGLFNTIKPYLEKAIELITKLSDSFRNLSDGDKLELAKLAGLATILPTLIVVSGTLIMMLGKVATAFIAVAMAPVKFLNVIFKVMEAIGKFKTLTAGKGFLEGIIAVFPKLEGMITRLYVFFSNIGTKIASVFAGIGKAFTAGGIVGGFKAILVLGAKVISMMALVIGAFTFFKDLLSNWSELGFFSSFEHAFVNLVNKVVEGIAKIVGILNENWAESIRKDFTIESSADKHAKELGYDGYDEMKKSQSALSAFEKQLNRITNGDYKIGFDIGFNTGGVWQNGAIGRLIEGINNGTDTPITSENVGEMKGAVSDVISQYKYINNLKQQQVKATKEETELTNKILKKREEMSKYKKGSEKYNKLQEEYNGLVEQKNQKAQFRVSNQEEIDSKIKEYEENVLVIQYKFQEAQENGVGEEFFYENFSGEFLKEFGVELVFKNPEESTKSLQELGKNLPELKQDILVELETAEGDYKNQLLEKLVELEKLEVAIPVALEIIETENKLLQYFGPDSELTKAEEKVLKIEADMAGLEKGSEAWNNLNEQHKTAQEELKKIQDECDALKKSLEELETKNPKIFENATKLAQILAENPNLSLASFLNGDKNFDGSEKPKVENNKATEFINENYNQDGSKKTPQQKLAEKKQKEQQQKEVKQAKKDAKEAQKAQKEIQKRKEEAQEYASNYEFVNPHGMPLLPGNTKLSNKTKEKLNEKYGKNGNKTDKADTKTDNNGTPITDNVKKDIEGAQNVANEATIDMPKVESEETPITTNIEADVEGATEQLSDLESKAQETLASFGEIDMSNLAEVFSVVLTLADEVRQRLIDIGNVANNSVKANFSGIADGLFEKLAEVREKLIAIGDVANNYVKNSISGILDGFMENISTVREAVIALGNVANNYLSNCLNNAGNGLKTSIESAREALLSIANVALGRGANSLLAMGQSLATGLNGAREKLLSICNVAYNRGVSAMSAMGQALSNSLSGAVGIAERVANIISGAVRQANSIKMPSIPTSPSVGTVSLAQPASLASMMRSTDISNSSRSTINTSSSNFNFAIDKVISNSNADLKNSARRLTTYCKRRGLF
ncbi:MAG: phage tail tape measure protein [Clostridium sp.]|nr:phage tail tape measure protein [Clostridium sp.]